MNIFFGIKSKLFQSRINIPKFRNNNEKKNDYSLYMLNIKNNNWRYEKIENSENSDFYFIDNQLSNNKNIFVISNFKEIKEIKKKNEIINLNSFTNTSPDFRSNLKIQINNGGFSSYQSDYPFSMTIKKGNILSPVSVLTNKSADLNYLIFKNIYYKPIKDSFNVYIVNIKTKKILDTIEVKTNKTNIFEIKKNFINPKIYIFSKEYLGIPIYVSIKNKHISMEHTHPPHEYIISEDKFYRVSVLKNKINEIIN